MSKVTIAKIVAYLIAFVAAVSSYGHQVHLLSLADLDPLFGIIPSEWITPATVDSLAIIALMVRTSDTVTVATRRWALVPLVLAGGMSVVANVATARNIVQVVVGVWTVAAYIIAELFVGKMERKQTLPVVQETVTEVTADDAASPDLPEAPVSPAAPRKPRGDYGPRDSERGYAPSTLRKKAAAAKVATQPAD